MNDSELQARLQSVRVPERETEYWIDFPADIRRQLPRLQREFAPRSAWRPRLQWAGALALGLAMMYVGERFHPLENASKAITKHERNLRVQVAQLESGLRILMFNPHGMGYLLAEAN